MCAFILFHSYYSSVFFSSFWTFDLLLDKYMYLKGNVFKTKIPQGDVRLRVDVTPEEVCQHWGLACR